MRRGALVEGLMLSSLSAAALAASPAELLQEPVAVTPPQVY